MTYLIDGAPYPLDDGQVTVETAPGAASKTRGQIIGEPVTGDLDGDGLTDAAVLLLQTTGGSGSFYFIAAALNRDGLYHGTDAVFVGDRIKPQQLLVRHGVIIFDYLDRNPDEPMAAPPSVETSKYLVASQSQLAEINLAAGEVIAAGEVVIGHEVRSFRPCGARDAAWLLGDSPALPGLQIAYHRDMTDRSPYAPLHMVLTGQPADPPADGFGADYPAGFLATRVISSRPGDSCQ